jgi:hypothetical protein
LKKERSPKMKNMRLSRLVPVTLISLGLPDFFGGLKVEDYLICCSEATGLMYCRVEWQRSRL